jgi:hypothetical protein
MAKKDLKEIVSEGPKVRILGLEESRARIEAIRKYQQLIDYMKKNFDDIFAKSPNKEDYAVGIWKEKEPEVHYFNDYRKSLKFMGKCSEKGETNAYLLNRDQRKNEYLLLIG